MTLDEQIASLEQAIGEGLRRVEIRSGGTTRVMEYQSSKDMQVALANLRARKAKQSGTSPVILASF